MTKPNKSLKGIKPKFVDLCLGSLPVEAINKTLGYDLEPGEVIFSAAAQKHAYQRHPNDFGRCLPFVGNSVLKPNYLGDDFKNHGKIEMISRLPLIGGGLLVALAIEPNGQGQYSVTSMYPIDDRKIENRRQNMRLKIVRFQ